MVLPTSIPYSAHYSFVSLTCPTTASVECTSTGVRPQYNTPPRHFASTTSSAIAITSYSSKTTPNACSTEPEPQKPTGPVGIYGRNNMPYLCCGDSGDQLAIWKDSFGSPTSSPRGQGR